MENEEYADWPAGKSVVEVWVWYAAGDPVTINIVPDEVKVEAYALAPGERVEVETVVAAAATAGLPMITLLPVVDVYPWLPYCNEEVRVRYGCV